MHVPGKVSRHKCGWRSASWLVGNVLAIIERREEYLATLGQDKGPARPKPGNHSHVCNPPSKPRHSRRDWMRATRTGNIADLQRYTTHNLPRHIQSMHALPQSNAKWSQSRSHVLKHGIDSPNFMAWIRPSCLRHGKSCISLPLRPSRL